MRKLLSISSMILSMGVSAQSILNISESEVTSRSATTASSKLTNKINRIAGAGTIYFEDFQNQADPNNPTFPPGWTLFNLDGLTPNPSVSYVNNAWIVRDDFIAATDPTDFAMFSTSWYSPAGQSNDWGITPAINLPSGISKISWVANAPDPSYPDGYEVYVNATGATVADCQAGDMLFTIAGENSSDTYREVSIPQIYENQTVYFCFRNNSFDDFILIIDDIHVESVIDNDVGIDEVAALPEYSIVADKNGVVEVPISVTFTNFGLLSQSNITVDVDIELDNVPNLDATIVYSGPLNSGESATVDFGTVPLLAVGVYDVFYTVTLDSVPDENPGDNTAAVMSVIEMTTDTMARDDGIQTGNLGIGAGNGGHLGNMFAFNEPITLSGVHFVYSNINCDANPPNACSLDGESTQVDVFQMDAKTGLPGALIASSEAHVIPAGQAVETSVVVNFTGGLNLMPGQYVFAVVEPVRTSSTFDVITMQVGNTDNRFTAGTVWINWPTSPLGGWGNAEDFGAQFAKPLRIRPLFDETDLIFRNGF